MKLERSVIVVAATDWKMIERTSETEADTVLLDLDDLVAPPHKVTSRANVIRGLNALDWGTKVRAFRMNALDTPYAYRDLIQVVEEAGHNLDLILVPKVGRPEDVYFVDTLLTQVEEQVGLKRRIGMEIQIETALGLMNINAIAFASPRTEALVFGPGDYSASLGMPLASFSKESGCDPGFVNPPWQFAMHQISVAARAAGLRPIDGPYYGEDTEGGFRQSCNFARSLGFEGKWCIDPKQVETANEMFLPDTSQIESAQQVWHAYQEATERGLGAVYFRGKLVDATSLKIAQATLERAREAGVLK